VFFIQLLLSNFSIYAYENEKLYIQIPFYFHNWREGNTDVFFSDDKIYVKADPILNWAKKFLTDKGQKTLIKQLKLNDRNLFVINLTYKKNRQVLFYNEDLHGIDINIPLQEKLILKTEINPSKPIIIPKEAKLYYPDPFSGYMNFYFSKKFTYDSKNLFYGSSQTYLNTVTSLNLNDWILNSSAFLIANNGSKNGYQVKRGNIQISRDFEKQNLRLYLGDISNSTISFQNSIPSIGLQVTKNPKFFNNIDRIAIDQQYFYLLSPSRVDIYVNKNFYQTRQLPAGQHELSAFPLLNGLNEVDLVITNSAGEERKLSLNIPYYSQVLAKNESNYSFLIGFPTYSFKDKEFDYQLNKLMCSFNHNFGWSHNTNIGWYSQFNNTQFNLGGQIKNYGKYLSTTLDYGFSYLYSSSPSFKSRVYFNFNNLEFILRRMNIFLGYTGKNYSYFGQANSQKNAIFNPYSFEYGFSTGKQIRNTQYSFSSTYSKHRANNDKNQYRLSVGARSNLFGGSFGVVLSYRKYNNSTGYYQASLNYFISLGKNTKLNTNYNTTTNRLQTTINNNQRFSGKRQLSTSVGVNTNFSKNNLTGHIDYKGERLNLSGYSYVSQGIVYYPDNYKVYATGNASLFASSALVFSGKTMSISSPISGGFCLISPDRYEDFSILVNSRCNNYDVKSTWILPAVYKTINNYSTNIFTVDGCERMPVTKSLSENLFCCMSKYKSGFSIKIPISTTIIIEGFLVDEEDNPLRYKSGYILFKENNQEHEIFFFTDSQGHFQIDNLFEGNYTICLENELFKPFHINLKKRGTNLIQKLGKIKIKRDHREND